VFWNRPDWRCCPLRETMADTYRRAAPGFAPSGPRHPLAKIGELVPDWDAEIARAQGFNGAEARTYSWEYRYTAAEYVRLLGTHSDHIVLDPATRTRLFDRIEQVITNHGGMLELIYLTQLCLARAA
jgi:hypothetical protein